MSGIEGLQRYTHTMLAIVLTVVVLYFGRDLILLSLVSALLTFMLLPLSRGMERNWGTPRWLASLAVALLLVLAGLGVVFVLGWQLSLFGRDLPGLQASLVGKSVAFMDRVEQLTHLDRRAQVEWFNNQLSGFGEWGGRVAIDLFSSTGAALAAVLPIPVFVFLLLLLQDRFRSFFQQVDQGDDGLVLTVMVRISKLSRKYLRGVLIVVLVLGVLNSIGFLLLDLEYAILFGFLAAFLNVVPYIGVLIGSLFPALLALVTKDSAFYALGAIGVCVLTQFLDNNFITPKVVGSSVSINPLASILALLGFGMLWGVVGMVVALPLTGMLKIICDAVPALQPYGFILGEEIDHPGSGRLRLPFLRSRKAQASPPAHDPPA